METMIIIHWFMTHDAHDVSVTQEVHQKGGGNYKTTRREN